MRRVLLVLAIIGVGITVSAAAAARREVEDTRDSRAQAGEIIPGTGANARNRLHDSMCRSTEAAEDIIALVDEDGDDRLTRQEIDRFSDRLAKLDNDNDDTITIDEAGYAAVMKIRDTTMWKLRNRYDENKDNAVSLDELGRDRAAYATLDVDRSGAIDSGDLAAIGEEACYASGVAPTRERGATRSEDRRPSESERRSRTPKGERDTDIESMRNVLPTVLTLPVRRSSFILAADEGLEIGRDKDILGDDELEVEYNDEAIFEWDDDDGLFDDDGEVFEWGDDDWDFDYSWGDDDDWSIGNDNRDGWDFDMSIARANERDLDDWGGNDGRFDYWWGDDKDMDVGLEYDWED
jgi:Ca2+-binding EF-hand superfamily protein